MRHFDKHKQVNGVVANVHNYDLEIEFEIQSHHYIYINFGIKLLLGDWTSLSHLAMG